MEYTDHGGGGHTENIGLGAGVEGNMQTMAGGTQITGLGLGGGYTDHGRVYTVHRVGTGVEEVHRSWEAVGEHDTHPGAPPLFGSGAQCHVGMWRREAHRTSWEVG